MAKHEIICKELRAEIASGRYSSSERMPSEAQLVERFGVSRPTVARALRDLENEDLIYRRAGAGTFVKSPTSDKKAQIVLGLLVPERGVMEIFDLICGELGSLARVHGYGLLWGSSSVPFGDRDSSPDHAREVCRQFIEKGVDGVFFAPMAYGENIDAVNREVVEMLRQSGIHTILLDRDIHPFPRRSRLDLVAVDNISGGFQMAEHMIRLGCTKLRFLAQTNTLSNLMERVCGVREAILHYGLRLNPNFEVYGDPSDSKLVRKLITGNSSDCIMCGSDLGAIHLLKTLTKLKVKVPDQIRITGFNDSSSAAVCEVPLTTIHQPCREIANVAFRSMQERIQTPSIPPRTIRLSPRLVVRESCGTYAG